MRGAGRAPSAGVPRRLTPGWASRAVAPGRGLGDAESFPERVFVAGVTAAAAAETRFAADARANFPAAPRAGSGVETSAGELGSLGLLLLLSLTGAVDRAAVVAAGVAFSRLNLYASAFPFVTVLSATTSVKSRIIALPGAWRFTSGSHAHGASDASSFSTRESLRCFLGEAEAGFWACARAGGRGGDRG